MLGVSHKTASLEVRGKLTRLTFHTKEVLTEIKDRFGLWGIILVSTCNRSEWVVHAEQSAFEGFLKEWDQDNRRLLVESEASFYVYKGREAISHLIKVAAGLDSLIVGESQILGQMKLAYSRAYDSNTLSPLLDRLFQRIFGLVKKLRSETELGMYSISVAYAAVGLAKQIFEDIRTSRVLLIGAGDTIERVASHLSENAVQDIVIANRRLENAKVLAKRVRGQAVHLSEITNLLSGCDIVFSATLSPFPIIGKGLVERALKNKKHRPLLMIDLAVPRDIEPEVATLADVYLYTIDDLDRIVEKNKVKRVSATTKALERVENAVNEIIDELMVLGVGSVIMRYRTQMETIRDREVTEALIRLSRGESPEALLIELGRTLTNKLLHKPCTFIRKMGENEQTQPLLNTHKILETAL